MNVFNRVLAILFLLGLIVILVLGILQPTLTIDTGRRVLDYLQGLAAANLMVYWVGAALLLFVAILLLILEVRRPQRLTVKVQQASGGIVELSTESVARSLEYNIRQVVGVAAVDPVVISKGKSVVVVLKLETNPDVDVPAKSEEVVQLTRELIEGKLGLKLGLVRVHIRQGSYSKELRPAAGRREIKGELPAETSPQS